MSITIISSSEGQVWDLGSRITCKVTSDSTNEAFTVLEVLLNTGQGSPVHVHRRESETIYVAEGKCVVGDNKQNQIASAGSVVVFPQGVPHFFRNDGSEQTKLIITAIPGGLDRYFTDVTAALQEGKPEQIDGINNKYEIEFFNS